MFLLKIFLKLLKYSIITIFWCFYALTNFRQPICPESAQYETNAAVADFANWLDVYFNNSALLSESTVPKLCTVNMSYGKYLFYLRAKFALPMFAFNIEGSFYDKVYTALLKVPFGKTVSYKELAALAGSPSKLYFLFFILIFARHAPFIFALILTFATRCCSSGWFGDGEKSISSAGALPPGAAIPLSLGKAVRWKLLQWEKSVGQAVATDPRRTYNWQWICSVMTSSELIYYYVKFTAFCANKIRYNELPEL